MDIRQVVFVCTGNVCRSPMAEYLLRRRLGRASGWTVKSAGLAAAAGASASWASVAVMREMGIDLTAHRSRPVTQALVDAAIVIVVMTASHRDQLRAVHPEAADRIHLLKSFDLTTTGWDIDDPMGLSIDVYRGIRDEINAAMPGLVAFLERYELPESLREGGWAWPLNAEGEDE